MPNKITFGIDPSLRHGAIVALAWDDDQFLEPSLIYLWTKKEAHSVGLKDPVDRISSLARRCQAALQDNKTYPCSGAKVFIDWDEWSGFRYSNKMLGIKMGFFAGCLNYAARSISMKPRFCPAKEVRDFFGLSARAEKEEVWKAFTDRYYRDDPNGIQNEDVRDALILAFLAGVLQ